MAFPTWFWIAAAISVALVMIADAGLLIAWTWNWARVRAGKARPIFSPAWSMVDAWVVGQAALAVVAVVSAAGGACMALAYGPPGLGAAGMAGPWTYFVLATLIIQAYVFAAGPMLLIRGRYCVDMSAIGLKPLPSLRDVVRGVLWGGVALAGGGAVQVGLTRCLRWWLPHGAFASLNNVSEQMSVDLLVPGVRLTPGAFPLLLLTGALLVPFGEEVLFRGLLYNCAKRRMGVTWGLIVSALAFAVAHGGPMLVLAIFPIGLLIGWVYERSGSLWTTVVLHATNNLVGLVAAYYGKG